MSLTATTSLDRRKLVLNLTAGALVAVGAVVIAIGLSGLPAAAAEVSGVQAALGESAATLRNATTGNELATNALTAAQREWDAAEAVASTNRVLAGLAFGFVVADRWYEAEMEQPDKKLAPAVDLAAQAKDTFAEAKREAAHDEKTLVAAEAQAEAINRTAVALSIVGGALILAAAPACWLSWRQKKNTAPAPPNSAGSLRSPEA